MYCVSTVRRFALGAGGKPPSSGTGHFSRFAGDERGGVAIMFGLMLGITVVLIGASVDMGRWMLARKQTQEAIDSANLAGLRNYQDTGDAAKAVATAKANYDYSVAQSKRGTTATNSLLVSDNIQFVLTHNNTQMTATGGVVIKMPFLGLVPQIVNFKTLPLLKTDGTENAVAVMAVGSNSGQSLEVAMMIDNTGSMADSIGNGVRKIDAVKTAAGYLVDQVVWADQSTYTSKVAIIPFDESVNVGSVANINTVRGTLKSGTSTTPGSQNYQYSTGGGGWGGGGGATYSASTSCVTERLGSNAYTDASPVGSPVGTLYAGNCPQSMVPLTTNTGTLHSTINAMGPGGSTAGHMGTAWAWYALSPNFNSIWTSASSAARPYADLTTLNVHGQPILRKIAILLTDGDYNTEYCNGVSDWYQNCSANNGASQSQASSLCTGMKAKGIEVFTIGAGVSANAKSFLTSCATDASHYYDATNTTAIYTAFDDITKKLVKPYVSH